MSMNDARRQQLERNLAEAEDRWHDAIQVKSDATKACDKAFNDYHTAQLALNTFLNVLLNARRNG